MKCLIMVDLQVGFMSPHTEALPGKVAGLAKGYQLLVATRFINAPTSLLATKLNWTRLMDGAETELVPEIKELEPKSFKKYGYQLPIELLELLRSKAISEVDVVGINTEICVLNLASNLFDQGILPRVLKNYCASNAGERVHKLGLEMIARNIGVAQVV